MLLYNWSNEKFNTALSCEDIVLKRVELKA